MARMKGNPKAIKYCAFCHYWMGNANLKFENMHLGFSFDRGVSVQCPKVKAVRASDVSANQCKFYEPSIEARRLL